MGRADNAKATSAEVERLVGDMRAFGATEEQIAEAVASLRGHVADPVFHVHPDNVAAVKLFAALMTQWNVVALSTMASAEIRRIGLKYEAIEPTARMAGIELGPGDFARLHSMEIAALNAWSEKR